MPIAHIYDATTGQVLEREMTAEEIALAEADKAAAPAYEEQSE